MRHWGKFCASTKAGLSALFLRETTRMRALLRIYWLCCLCSGAASARCLSPGESELAVSATWGSAQWYCLQLPAPSAWALWPLLTGFEAKVSAPSEPAPARLRLGLRAPPCAGGSTAAALDTDDEKISWVRQWPLAPAVSSGGGGGGDDALGPAACALEAAVAAADEVAGAAFSTPARRVWLYVNATPLGLAAVGARGGAAAVYDVAFDGVAAGALPHRVLASLGAAAPLVFAAAAFAAQMITFLLEDNERVAGGRLCRVKVVAQGPPPAAAVSDAKRCRSASPARRGASRRRQ